MYGLLLENLSEYIKSVYGEDKWEDIRRQAGIDSPSFSVHQVYPENLLNKIAKKAQQVLGVSEREFMDQMGVYFVNFVSQYGYDRVLSVLGRHMRDFLNGLDNLHEYLKFSYPRMRAPSFICENETRQGLTLHYRSKRRGFVYYTMGQIREVARHFYHKEMHIELVREEILFDTVHVTFQLTFDNRAFTLASLAMTREEKHLPISASVLFEIFPFCIVFGSDLVVRSIGNSLMVILPDLVGKKITNWFELVRPLIAFKFQTILNRTNNIFELVTVDSVPESPNNHRQNEILEVDNQTDDSDSEKNLRLKGQMIYMDNWKMIMFLGTPVMPDLTSLIKTGLYINDLSMHDFSRDLMLAGTQQSVELKLALDQEQQKSKKLEESMRKLDEEMRRTDELLYQMIPKQVADRLRRGENPIDTCEMFDSVSILFSDVVTFTEICSRITPMEVVSMLNAMYSIFDKLTERNNVYKVETIGDAYMVVSGAPEKEQNHAEKVCDMALDMVEAITDLKDPSTGEHLRIRVGVHSGAVVAGIVGLKMPRYCLFGDSVNTASRMESTSSAMKIHISESTNDLLGPIYKVIERGEIDVKGKGSMKTYWLVEREHRKPLSKVMPNLATELAELKPTSPLVSAVIERKPLSAERRRSISQTIKTHVDLMRDRERNPDRDSSASALSNEVDRRVYSPVTFQDVARHSTANSPVRTLFNSANRGRESRSNSTGHVFMHSPSDVFGSLISDTEDFLDDLHTNNNHRSSLGTTPYKSTISATSSPPFSPPNMRLNAGSTSCKPVTPGNFSEDELSMLDAISPTPSTLANMDKYALDVEVKSSKLKDFKSNVSGTLSASTVTTASILPVSLATATSLNSAALSATPMSSQHSTNRKGILKNNQAKALEKLDKMVEEMFDTNLAGMCPLNFLPPPPPKNSKSDSNLCAHHHHHHIDDEIDNNDNSNNSSSSSNNNNSSIGHPHNHSYLHHHHHHHHQQQEQQQQQQQQRLVNSRSFVHPKDHQCCPGFGHPVTQNGRHRIHSHACQII